MNAHYLTNLLKILDAATCIIKDKLEENKMNLEDFSNWVYDIERICEENGIEKKDVNIYGGNADDIDMEIHLEFPNKFKIIKSIDTGVNL